MSPITLLALVAGLVLLVIGAEFLVKGASRVAAILNIPPLDYRLNYSGIWY